MSRENQDERFGSLGQPPGQRKSPADSPGPGSGFRGWPPQQWTSLIWYFLLMLGILWFWQEASHQLTTRTVPYSQFKDLVAQRRVADLTINDTEITGKALAQPAIKGKPKQTR